jgi:nicotinamide-nucleotide amidase
MTAEIITIGDELLIGQVVNTNQAFIADQLNAVGIHVARMTTVGDDAAGILAAFGAAWRAAEVVVVTGGLGPTHDDITKKTVCTFFETDLVSDPGVRAHIAELLQKRNAPWGPAAEEQTMVPRAATVLPNPAGTAAGMLFTDGEKSFIVLPGVPYEMREIMTRSVIPRLSSQQTGRTIVHRTLRTTGISESLLMQQLGDLDRLLDGAKLAFLPSPTGVRLRISVYGSAPGPAGEKADAVEQRLRAIVAKYTYATGEEEIEEVLGKILTARALTLAVAESCTGGLIASRLTDVSGSSAYFERGVVTYSNRSKIDLLHVPADMIEQHGAVSREVAVAMAEGVRAAAGTAVGLSTTGIAGPTGGTPEKPVGLLWAGYADGRESLAVRFLFADDRRRFKERASQAALELLRRRLLGIA